MLPSRVSLAVLAVVAALAGLSPAGAVADPGLDLALKALREDPSLKVRAQAALVLGQRRAAEAAPTLSQALERDEAAVVRIAAASALGKLGERTASALLQRAARQDADPGVRAAAARALERLDPAPAGRLVLLEEPTGDAGGAPARSALRGALERHLRTQGFEVAASANAGRSLRLKPSVVRVTVDRAGEGTIVSVTASLLAIEPGGRVAAMLEGSARLRAAGAASAEALAGFQARALDAAARTLGEDLAARVGGR